jgi:multidrug efflux pump subunit AcrA (membrane-fusion protein)
MQMIKKITKKIKKFFKLNFDRALKFIEAKPLVSICVLISALVVMIVVGNVFRQPKSSAQLQQPAKMVSIYKVGSVPKLSFQAQVEKSGVVQITAQTGGIVSYINVSEGSKLNRGTQLISLANNYTGGNVMTLSRELAQKQNEYTESVYPIQKDLINKQRDVVNLNQTNFEKIREITNQSVTDTQNLINLNNEIISTLDTNIQNLSVDPVGNATLILTSKQLASQFKSANNQLNSALRSASYQANSGNPPSGLSEDQKNIALAQLNIQDKSLDLGRDVSNLQLKLARINESLMYPASPFAGTVEKVFVRVGQAVGPGTPLVTISGTNNVELNATVYLSKDMANSVSKIEPTVFHIGGKTVSVLPMYISKEAITGNLYGVIYHLPVAEYANVTDKSYITADIPMGYPDTNSVVPFLPLDTIYQTQEESYVFVAENGKATTKKIELGNVIGNYVQIKSGLTNGDMIIEDRNIISGQSIEIK